MTAVSRRHRLCLGGGCAAPRPNSGIATVDLDAAHRHLRFLDPGEPRHTFQVLPDVAGALRRIYHGPLDAVAPHLIRANEAGAGVFVMVNAGDLRGRKRENVVHVRFAFVDLDGAPLPDPEEHQAHGVVWSSPGRAHLYWRVIGVPLGLFRPIQRGLAATFGGDPSVCDLPRVLRLAGFVHRKREPFRVMVSRFSDNAQPYTLSEVRSRFPLADQEVRRAQEAANHNSLSRGAPWRIRQTVPSRSFSERLLEYIEHKAAMITATGRHALILWVARACVDNGLGEGEAAALALRARDLLPPRADGIVPDFEVLDVVSWVFATLTPGQPWNPRRPVASGAPPSSSSDCGSNVRFA